MTISANIAKHFREVYFGGNWTWSNMKDNLADVNWQEATTKIDSLNTIATLTFHINYYVTTALNVLKGGPLTGNDKFAFTHPPIHSEKEWQDMLANVWREGEEFAALVEKFPDERLQENMADEKYGSWYRNLHGIIEHAHYHLGQIAVLKKIIRENLEPAIGNRES